jgi:hypothetical protein
MDSLKEHTIERLRVAGFLKKPMSRRALLDTVERFATAASGDEAATAYKRQR